MATLSHFAVHFRSMKPFTRLFAPIFALLLVASACNPSADEDVSPPAFARDTSEEGRQALFNGTDFTGFRGYAGEEVPARWEVRDSALHLAPVDRPGGDLMTASPYDRYELSFEFRLTECANSGVIYGVDPAGEQSWHSGVEYQLLDDSCAEYSGVRDDQKLGSAYEMFPAGDTAPRPIGEWSEGRIVVDGNQVEHWLNGQEVVEYERGGEEWKRELADSKFTQWPCFGTTGAGFIVFRDHSDEVWFRKIRIRSLSE